MGPKRLKNRTALIKFIILAATAAVVGSGLALLAGFLLGPTPTLTSTDADAQEKISILHNLPGVIISATLITVLAFLFFGVRAYFSGIQARHAMLKKRSKFS